MTGICFFTPSQRSVNITARWWMLEVERNEPALLGVSQQHITEVVAAALGGLDVTYLRIGGGQGRYHRDEAVNLMDCENFVCRLTENGSVVIPFMTLSELNSD